MSLRGDWCLLLVVLGVGLTAGPLMAQAEEEAAAEAPQGQWCGLTGIDSKQPRRCQGLNPQKRCPGGYEQLMLYVEGGMLCTNMYGCTIHYACMKQ